MTAQFLEHIRVGKLYSVRTVVCLYDGQSGFHRHIPSLFRIPCHHFFDVLDEFLLFSLQLGRVIVGENRFYEYARHVIGGGGGGPAFRRKRRSFLHCANCVSLAN